MPVHVHTMRSAFAATNGLITAAILLGWAYQPPPDELELVTVTGRATCGGRPLDGMRIVFEEVGPRGFIAIGEVRHDGSFRMEPWGHLGRDGVAPGTYRVYFVARTAAGSDSEVAPKYRASGTSDLVVHVGPDWNDLVFSLPDARTGPTLAHHR